MGDNTHRTRFAHARASARNLSHISFDSKSRENCLNRLFSLKRCQKSVVKQKKSSLDKPDLLTNLFSHLVKPKSH